jgi:hypothetical protein
MLKFADQLTSLPKNTRENLVPLYMGIIDCLVADETLKQVVMKLYVASMDWNNIQESVAYLNKIVQCISNQPHRLDDANKQVAQNLKDSKGYWNPETILEIVDIIRLEGCYESQFIGLALLEVAGSVLLWSPDCARLLRLYRNHTNLAIRSLALDIWTAID